jgi:acyl dehydratase
MDDRRPSAGARLPALTAEIADFNKTGKMRRLGGIRQFRPPLRMTFSHAIDDRYFEDYVEGDVHHLGSIAVEADEIVAFAKRYDPQNFHCDPEAAKATPFGGLIASGWHTAALMMRLYVEHYLTHVASLASPGLDELRWLKPVRPGDRLSVRVTVLKAAPSRSKPDRGAVTSLVEVFNQANEPVMTLKAVNIIARRPRPDLPA